MSGSWLPACGEIDLQGVRASSQTSRGNRCDVRARAEKKAFH
jgi:hypothetical protein